MRRNRSLHVSNATKGHSYINMRQKVNFLLQPNAFLQKSITDYKAPKKSLSASKLFLSIELRRRPHSLTYLAYRSPFQTPQLATYTEDSLHTDILTMLSARSGFVFVCLLVVGVESYWYQYLGSGPYFNKNWKQHRRSLSVSLYFLNSFFFYFHVHLSYQYYQYKNIKSIFMQCTKTSLNYTLTNGLSLR